MHKLLLTAIKDGNPGTQYAGYTVDIREKTLRIQRTFHQQGGAKIGTCSFRLKGWISEEDLKIRLGDYDWIRAEVFMIQGDYNPHTREYSDKIIFTGFLDPPTKNSGGKGYSETDFRIYDSLWLLKNNIVQASQDEDADDTKYFEYDSERKVFLPNNPGKSLIHGLLDCLDSNLRGLINLAPTDQAIDYDAPYHEFDGDETILKTITEVLKSHHHTMYADERGHICFADLHLSTEAITQAEDCEVLDRQTSVNYTGYEHDGIYLSYRDITTFEDVPLVEDFYDDIKTRVSNETEEKEIEFDPDLDKLTSLENPTITRFSNIRTYKKLSTRQFIWGSGHHTERSDSWFETNEGTFRHEDYRGVSSQRCNLSLSHELKPESIKLTLGHDLYAIHWNEWEGKWEVEVRGDITLEHEVDKRFVYKPEGVAPKNPKTIKADRLFLPSDEQRRSGILTKVAETYYQIESYGKRSCSFENRKPLELGGVYTLRVSFDRNEQVQRDKVLRVRICERKEKIRDFLAPDSEDLRAETMYSYKSEIVQPIATNHVHQVLVSEAKAVLNRDDAVLRRMEEMLEAQRQQIIEELPRRQGLQPIAIDESFEDPAEGFDEQGNYVLPAIHLGEIDNLRVDQYGRAVVLSWQTVSLSNDFPKGSQLIYHVQASENAADDLADEDRVWFNPENPQDEEKDYTATAEIPITFSKLDLGVATITQGSDHSTETGEGGVENGSAETILGGAEDDSAEITLEDVENNSSGTIAEGAEDDSAEGGVGNSTSIKETPVPKRYRFRVRVVVYGESRPVVIRGDGSDNLDEVNIEDPDNWDSRTNIHAQSPWSDSLDVEIRPWRGEDIQANSIEAYHLGAYQIDATHLESMTLKSTNWEKGPPLRDADGNPVIVGGVQQFDDSGVTEGSKFNLLTGSAKFRTQRRDDTVSEVLIGDDFASGGVVEHGVAVEDKLVEGKPPFHPVRTGDGDIITQENFPGWDFENTWEMREGAWPKLQWQSRQTDAGNTEEEQRAYTLIHSAADLQKVRDELDGNFRLENDIELSGAFEPIGSEENPFVGVFDGNDKTISGLQIAETDKAGFFAQIGAPEVGDVSVYQQGVVRNLNLVLVDGDAENPSIAGSAFAGAVAGQSYGRIEAVEVSGGSVQGSAEESRVGGIVGENSGYVDSVTVYSSITTNEEAAILGGIVGENSGHLYYAWFDSNMTVSKARTVLGGIAGKNSGYIDDVRTIKDITGSGANIIFGGIVGENTGYVHTANAESTLTASGESVFLGGIAGKNGGYINDSTVRGDTIISSGTNAVLGGFAGENTGYINSGRVFAGITASGTGSVLGGIAGENSGCLRDMVSGETGNITASGTESVLGGIAGKNSGQIDEGRVVRSIIGDETDAVLGGVAGENEGDINGSTFSGSLERDGQELTDVLIGSNIEAADITYELINNGADLQKIRDNLAGTFKLANDIILSGVFDPIGSKDDPFVGILEGNGNTIIGLQIAQADEDYVGFFVQIGRTGSDEDYDAAANGLVRNLKLELIDGNGRNPSITGKKYVGALAGANRGRIENCSAERGVIRGNDRLGGLVGLNSSGSITNSSADISIELNESIELTGNNENKSYLCLGGLVGCNFSGSITNGYANGSIYLDQSIELTGENIELINLTLGGLVGDNNGSISNSEADGSIELDESIELSGSLTRDNLALRFGGLAGLNHDSIINSQANGSVAISGDSVNCHRLYLGGLAGVSASSSVTNSTAGGDVLLEGNTVRSKSLNLGGLVGWNSESRTKNSVSYGSVRLSGDTVQYTELYSGGLTGRNADSSITNSKASGGVTMGDSTELSADNAEDSTYLDFAGLVGSNKDSRISNSSAGGEIDLNGSVSLNGSSEGHNRLRLGGLVGWNNGKITANHASASVKISGTITEDTIYMRLGGLVGTNSGSIINDIASGGVELTGSVTLGGTVEDSNYLQLGGLVGRNYDNARIVNGSVFEASELNGPIKLSGSVTLNGSSESSNVLQLGGLVGGSSGSIIKSNANKSITLSGTVELTGTSTSSNSLRLGGLIGGDTGSITKSSASGAVTLRDGTVRSTYLNLGGLTGTSRGSISDSIASGAVTLDEGIITSRYLYLGGLVGANSGSITDSTTAARGSVVLSGGITEVDRDTCLGGLAGTNNATGSITNSTANARCEMNAENVNSTYLYLSGLVGWNGGSILQSRANGAVTGRGSVASEDNHLSVGGLVGVNWNEGNIASCVASGDVNESISGTGDNVHVGGLVGENKNSITRSAANGTVNGSIHVGGLVGFNDVDTSVTLCAASGAVNGTGDLGGLVGNNSGTIQDCTAGGAVTGIGSFHDMGGLAGQNQQSIERCYAIGTVSGVGYGGNLVGKNLADAEIQTSYFDMELTGLNRGVGRDVGESSIGHYYSFGIPAIGKTRLDALGLAMSSPYGAAEYGIHLEGIFPPNRRPSIRRDLRISANTGIKHTITSGNSTGVMHDTIHPLGAFENHYGGHFYVHRSATEGGKSIFFTLINSNTEFGPSNIWTQQPENQQWGSEWYQRIKVGYYRVVCLHVYFILSNFPGNFRGGLKFNPGWGIGYSTLTYPVPGYIDSSGVVGHRILDRHLFCRNNPSQGSDGGFLFTSFGIMDYIQENENASAYLNIRLQGGFA